MTTPLDQAHAAMQAAPDNDAARLAFFGRLADCELFILLEGEPDGEDIAPELFNVEEGQFALVFDQLERLVALTRTTSPYAALTGRALVRMLAGQDIGLALNPGIGVSEMLIPAAAVDWLAEVMAQAPVARGSRPVAFGPPDGVAEGVPEGLFAALDGKLAGAGGLARAAWLVAAEWDEGSRGLALAFVGAPEAAQAPLAQAVAEALAFSGLGSGWLDVIFLPDGGAAAVSAAKVGLGFVLPQAAAPVAPTAPGMDPDRPPRLR